MPLKMLEIYIWKLIIIIIVIYAKLCFVGVYMQIQAY